MQSLTLSLSAHVTLCRLLNSSVPQFTRYKMEMIRVTVTGRCQAISRCGLLLLTSPKYWDSRGGNDIDLRVEMNSGLEKEPGVHPMALLVLWEAGLCKRTSWNIK